MTKGFSASKAVTEPGTLHITQRVLSAAEETALRLLHEEGGSLIEWRVPACASPSW